MSHFYLAVVVLEADVLLEHLFDDGIFTDQVLYSGLWVARFTIFRREY